MDEIKDLEKKIHYSQVEVNKIISGNVSEYLEKVRQEDESQVVTFYAIAKDSSPQLNFNEILLWNQDIKQYLADIYFRYQFISINVKHIYDSGKEKRVELDEFDEYIWKKCLEESSKNPKIKEMKDFVDYLFEKTWNLIGEISKY